MKVVQRCGRCRVSRHLLDCFDIEVGDEPLRVGGPQHNRTHLSRSRQLCTSLGDLDEDIYAQQIDRRVIDGERGDSTVIDGDGNRSHGISRSVR